MVPWRVGLDVDSLTAAMKARDVPLILHLSADLGHYVADMHVRSTPRKTTTAS